VGEPLVRVVVVGLGRIGRLHAGNLGAALAGVVDAVEPIARAAGERHGVPWSTSLEELVPLADGVVIAAPTALHPPLVEQVAAAGLDVFCEKPLGFTEEDARRAVEAAPRLQVGYQRRFDPDWLALSAADLGELALFRCSHRNAAPPGPALGDVFVDVAVHDLDAARWLVGDVAELHAWERTGAACISLRFENGALGLIDVSRRAGYGFECAAELVGSRATMRIGAVTGTELLREGHSVRALPATHAERHAAAYRAELEHFVSGGGGAPAATGADAAAALRLALLARRSADTGTPIEALVA
jgi:predicted dehydrogenase